MLYYVIKVYIPDYWSSFIYTRNGNLQMQQKNNQKKNKNIIHKKQQQNRQARNK